MLSQKVCIPVHLFEIILKLSTKRISNSSEKITCPMNHLESPPNLSLSLRKFWSCKHLGMKLIFNDILKIFRWMYWKQLKIISMLHWILKTPDENVCCLIFQIKLNLEHRQWWWFWHLWSLIPEHSSLVDFNVDFDVALKVNAIVLFASRQIWPSCHAAFDVISCGYPVVWEEHLCTMQCSATLHANFA